MLRSSGPTQSWRDADPWSGKVCIWVECFLSFLPLLPPALIPHPVTTEKQGPPALMAPAGNLEAAPIVSFPKPSLLDEGHQAMSLVGSSPGPLRAGNQPLLPTTHGPSFASAGFHAQKRGSRLAQWYPDSIPRNPVCLQRCFHEVQVVASMYILIHFGYFSNFSENMHT